MAQSKVDRIVAFIDEEIGSPHMTEDELVDILERVVEELIVRIDAIREDEE